MSKLFNKKKSMQQTHDYPYYAEQQLFDGWKVKCCCYRENSSRLFDYIIQVIDPQGLQIGFMNLEIYETCNMRQHMKTICENPKEYIGYTQHGEWHMYWDLDSSLFDPIPFEVIWELFPWIESQLQIVSNLSNHKANCDENTKLGVVISESITIDLKDADENLIENLATIKI